MPLMRSLTTSPRAAPARNRARNVRTSRTARRLPAHGPASTAAWPHLTAGSSAWEASPRQAPTPGQANGLRRVSAPAPRHAARGRGSAILRATTRGAGGGSGPLASNLERWGSTPSWWHGAVYAALSGDIRPDIDVARGLWRAVAVQIPGARGAPRSMPRGARSAAAALSPSGAHRPRVCRNSFKTVVGTNCLDGRG